MSIALSKNWLSEIVNVEGVDIDQILTQAGLEIDGIDVVNVLPDTILIGEILTTQPHPNANKLNICQVKIAEDTIVEIICGCSTVKAGLKVVVATVGAILPGDFKITARKLRGIMSYGMLCSAAEINLVANSSGIMHLDTNAPIGMPIARYLQQTADEVFQVDITPNRGDCLSVYGLARELNSLHNNSLEWNLGLKAYDTKFNSLNVNLLANSGLKFIAVQLSSLDLTIKTPDWIVNRLAMFNQTSVNVLVDVLNYVMFELGQPLHCYDANKLVGDLSVRYAIDEEKILLLNDTELALTSDDLVVADSCGAVALAGVMGGARASVTQDTNMVVIEAANFQSEVIANMCRRYNINSDAAYRFERGVDYNLANLAITRVLAILSQITKFDLTADVEVKQQLATKSIFLDKSSIDKILGIKLSTNIINDYLDSLNCKYEFNNLDKNWQITPPSYRHDLKIDRDIIEELLRLNGLDALPAIAENLILNNPAKGELPEHKLRGMLANYGFYEVVNYSFVCEKHQGNIFNLDNTKSVKLSNPISTAMNVMRVSCWPGLITMARHNFSRQKYNFKLFEIGNCFINTDNKVITSFKLSGLLAGNDVPIQWQLDAKPVDFFTAKGVCEQLLAAAGILSEVEFVPSNNWMQTALHPGQSADIVYQGGIIGCLGVIHPRLKRALKLANNVVMFELEAKYLLTKPDIVAQSISKYPIIKRDLALVVDKTCNFVNIKKVIQDNAPNILIDIVLFDVYIGDKLSNHQQSIALSLYFQSNTDTLKDEEVNCVIDMLVKVLDKNLGAKIREF